MSLELGTYSFLPWLRLGLANQLQAVNTPGKTRATVHVRINIRGTKKDSPDLNDFVERDVEIYGPGDIIGIDPRVIIKNEPHHWITNFETNYLPYVDFYDEDFLWRYTPEVPDKTKHRLRPWISLIVLREDEFDDTQKAINKPLPFIDVKDPATAFPRFDQIWAWAHVHVNQDIAAKAADIVAKASDMDTVLGKFEALLKKDPDLAHSRLLCPRKLDENTAYHAFIIPSFETGRLAGLGLDPADSPSVTQGAWIDYAGKAETTRFPYYHRWYFRTGTVGDFEYLVRLLQPKPVDLRVGRRDMDVLEPGSNISGIDKEALGGILKLGGALRIPVKTLKKEDRDQFELFDNWDSAYPEPFQSDLAAFINLADDYQHKAAQQANTDSAYDASIPDPDHPGATKTDPDPLIVPPLYGTWPAMQKRLLTEFDGSPVVPNDQWIHELNLDPRYRVAAAFGTQVVQTNQEAYMDAAWEQIGDVIEANRRTRQTQLAFIAANRWYMRYILPLQASNPERVLTLVTPIQKHVMTGGKTTYFHVKNSRVPYAALSTTTRRILRPRGRLIRSLPFEAGNRAVNPGTLITRINEGKVTPAPPKAPPDGTVTLDDIADALAPEDVPSAANEILKRYPWLPRFLMLLILLLVLLIFLLQLSGILLGLAVVGLAALGFVLWQVMQWGGSVGEVESIRDEKQKPGNVNEMPKSPNFRLSRPGDSFTAEQGRTDSPEAQRFKAALKDVYTLVEASRKAAVVPERKKLNLPALTAALVDAINPAVTIPRHLYAGIFLPDRIRLNLFETFVEAMAYPEIDKPMYEPLVKISSELFLPNINYIEQNTISLLETNQAFIESYMVGLNHEFARELLWREYPTDQRGSYFRQFWDVSSYLSPDVEDEEALRESLKDIPPLHLWSKHSALGSHDHRETGGESEEEVVLVIRGELLKKYPTAVIYAHRAVWQKDQNGKNDTSQERRLKDIPPGQEKKPPRDIVKTPLYEAKVDPDIYFFGFDLTAEKARGGSPDDDDPDPGWFFVIKERPGEPRFGLDIGTAATVSLWNDLAWGNIIPNEEPGKFIEITQTINFTPLPDDGKEQAKQSDEDKAVKWDPNTNAAELAYILYQVPVLVAVHAAEMLPKPG